MATKAPRKKNVVAIKPDVTTQLEALRQDVALLADAVKIQTKTVVGEKTETAKAIASEKTEAAIAKYDELSTRAETSIKENPLTSVAIAVGVGLLLGAVTRR